MGKGEDASPGSVYEAAPRHNLVSRRTGILRILKGVIIKPLPIEPKDTEKPCLVKLYNCWFTSSRMFSKIIEEAKRNNWKIVDFKDGTFSVTVTFQER